MLQPAVRQQWPALLRAPPLLCLKCPRLPSLVAAPVLTLTQEHPCMVPIVGVGVGVDMA